MKDFLTDEDLAVLEAQDQQSKDPNFVSDDDFATIEAEAKEYDSPVLAGLAGAARGLTFGLSDVAGRAVGLDDELAKLKEYNPKSSIGGEITGAIAPVVAATILSAGTATPAALAGQSAAQGALRAAPSVLAATAGEAAAAKLGGGLLAKAAGTAVEGALYGTGTGISKAALDQRQDIDAADVGETLAAEIGLGALTGGAFSLAGSAVSKTAGAIAKGAKSGISKAVNKLNGESLEAAAQANISDDLLRDSIKIGEKNEEALSAWRSLGVAEDQLPKASTYKDGFVRRKGEFLVESDSIAGRAEAAKAARGIKVLTDNAETSILDGHTNDAIIPDAEAIIGKVSSFLDDKVKPLEEVYESLEQSFVGTEISEKARKAVAKNILDLEAANIIPGSSAESAAKRYASAIETNATDLNKLKRIRTAVGNDLEASKRAGDFNLSDALYEIKDKLTEMRKTWVRKNIERTGLERGDSAKLINETLETVANADKGYAQYKTLVGDVSEALGLKRNSSPSRIIEALEKKNDQTALKKLFNIQDKRSLELIKKEMPEVFDSLQANFKNDIYKKSFVVVNGESVFSPKLFARNVKKLNLNDDMLKLVLGDAQTYRFKTFETAANSLPEKFMKGSAPWLSMQSGITATAVREASDFALSRALELAPRIQKAIKSQENTIQTKFLNFLDRSSRVIKPAVLQGTLSTSQNDVDRIERIVDLSNNPEKLAEMLAENTRSISDTDMDVGNEVSDSVIRAATFLAEKAPKKPQTTDFFGDSPFQPSDAELAKFNRYVKAVDAPLSIMDDLESGVLQPESVDAVATVFPRLYKRMVDNAMSYAGSGKKLSYASKMQLATLLRMPVSSTMSPQFIQAMQANNVDPMVSDAEMKKGNVTGLKDLSVAQSTKTAVQQNLTRA